LTWKTETFAYAEGYDGAAARYRGLRAGQGVIVSADDPGLIVKPEVASKQLETEAPKPERPATATAGQGSGVVQTGTGFQEATITQIVVQQFRRFYGTARLDSARVGRDAGRIAEEVIAHLTGQMAAEVTVTIEIVATLPNGASDQLVRTVTENCRTLRFDSQGFERE
jgi:hypothetical protein